MDAANKRVFPVELVKIMRRQAEDLLISDTSSQKGKDTLTFIVTLAKARSDLENFKKGWVFYRQPFLLSPPPLPLPSPAPAPALASSSF